MAIDHKDKKVLNVPPLRFPEFSGEWEESNLSKFSFKITKKNKGNVIQNVLCNSANLGIIPQNDYFDRDIANTDNTASYYIIERGDFVYNPRKSTAAPYGPVNIYTGETPGIISPLYLCFSVHNIFPNFLFYRFKSSVWHPYVYSHGDTGVRFDRVSIKDDVFFDMPIYAPTQKEQEKIVTLLSLIEERIATQNKIIEDLKLLKSAIIETEYNGKGQKYRIGDIIEQTSLRNKSNLIKTVLSVNNKLGFISQDEQFEDRTVASEDTSYYKIVTKDDFAYNPARINVGSIARLKSFGKGIVSPMYICFKVTDGIVPEYLESYFATNHFFKEMQKRLEGSVRLCLSFEGLCNIQIAIPNMDEQAEIGKRIHLLEGKIETECNILSQYEKQKRYLLHQMFI